MDKATGWTKNREGQWIEGKNKIHQAAMSVSNKADWEKETNALGKDNFIRYEIRDIKISGLDFLLFLKIMHYGYWQNPTTQYDWHPQDRVYYAVIKKNESKTEKNFFDPQAMDYTTTIYFLSYLPYDSSAFTKITLMINKEDLREPDFRKYGTTRTLLVRHKPIADKNVSRFHLYADGINSSGVNLLPPDSDERLINVFADFYFECQKDKFEGLTQLIEPKSKK